MLLHSDPKLAEVGDLSREQLDALAASVELRRQQLERDIAEYVKLRQDELRSYEQELLAHHRSMECTSTPPTPSREEKTKRTRVQKREKELYGLVTPVFLPLLDARDSSPTHERKKPSLPLPLPHHARTHDAIPEHSSAPDARAMSSSDAKKSKRPSSSSSSTSKKSALRTHASKPRRKRVSLVIDGQTVLPADLVAEPSDGATSASNSTASLDSLIDPRLTSPTHVPMETVHHSLPLPTSTTVPMSMSHPISPTKPLVETPTSLAPDSELVSSPAPLSQPQLAQDDTFDTYVGGLRGSGADDVDQAGSYGYPSSLGASYLESYMQSRPLRVRMEAADKAGLGEEERREMVREKDGDEDGDGDVEMSGDEVGSLGGRRKEEEEEDEDGDDFMGEMEGF
ncbi:hypothetical protein HBI70_219830 [Parastagonospora nodorum]|nr:hypothetical protein HBI06_230890 [Parastagonospora nodorum]KAH4226272.1 hypothetical protein HBI05_222430 [Parastagonospora nodorum]KAH5247732.1 hypothetical protein HBI70_219830 [Parastagonospora nodorum]KAH5496196.1 hypothetical protein HBI29_178190 [Parastagonospora nodorum]KAH6324478.1 hypothetical protein HBI37_220090 [Parastagonospora nodorum]